MDDGYERITLERLSSGRAIPWYCSAKKTPLTSTHLGLHHAATSSHPSRHFYRRRHVGVLT